jgi:DNA-directed RNA polymerase specialized sigma24 family protein
MALGAEASLKRVTMKDLASDLIWRGLAESSKMLAEHAAQGFVDYSLATDPNVQEAEKPFIQEDKSPNNQMVKGPYVQNSVHPGEVGVVNSSSQKKKELMPRIDSCVEIQQKIADLWAQGELTREEIADEIGYPRSTVKNWIKIQLVAGKLSKKERS